MKKLLVFSGLLIILESCSTSYSSNYPVRRPSSNIGSASTPSATAVEKEYNELLKTYKPETIDVLNDLLNNSSPNNPNTSVTVENKSPCNMVLTISGNNFYKKIPIGAGKIGYAMVRKNQNYKLSGMVCKSVYQTSKFISDSYSVTLSK